MRSDYLQHKGIIAGVCLWMAVAVGAAACGGSSGGGAKPNPTPRPFPTPTATETATPTPTPTATPTPATPTPTPRAKGGLWVPGLLGPEVTMIGPTDRVASGTPPPQFANLSPSFQLPAALSFDTSGNMWVNNCGTGQILEFTSAQLIALSSNPAPAPNLTVNEPASFGSPPCPWGSEFDSLGNLWLSNRPLNGVVTNLVAYGPSQLSAGGDQTPNTIIASTMFADLRTLEFDANGNLWVLENQNKQLLGYKAATIVTALGKAGAVDPDIVISSTSLVDPRGMAFDAMGNIWISDASNLLFQFAAADLASSGARTPQVTLGATSVPVGDGTASSLDIPEGLAFDDDDSGNLWVSNTQSNNVGSIVEYTASQLSGSGSPSPNIFLNSDMFGINFHAPGVITFGPIP